MIKLSRNLRKGVFMQITNLDKEEVLQVAQVTFKDKYIEMNESDLFIPDIEKGCVTIDGIEHKVYISTHYAYEDRLVHGNKTRYKIPLTTILLKKDKYEVIYDSYGKYYVAYKNEEGIQFVPYEDFYDLLKPFLHIEEKD